MLATDVLEQQHREIEELLREVEAVEEPYIMTQKRKDLADTILAHFAIVETVFHKVAIQFAGENAIPRALETQHAIAYMLWRLMHAPMDRTVFPARLDVLKELLMNHMEEQESELFVAVKAEMPRPMHRDLGTKLEKSYEEFMRIGYAPLLANHFAMTSVPAPTKATSVAKGEIKPLRFVQIAPDGTTLAGITKAGRVYRRCPHTHRWIPSTMMRWKAPKTK